MAFATSDYPEMREKSNFDGRDQRNAIRRQRDPTVTRSDGNLLQVLTASIAVERADIAKRSIVGRFDAFDSRL